MPTYRLRCPECGAEYDQRSPVERGPVEMDCPDCAYQDLRVRMRQVFTAPGVVFKGSGWAGKS